MDTTDPQSQTQLTTQNQIIRSIADTVLRLKAERRAKNKNLAYYSGIHADRVREYLDRLFTNKTPIRISATNISVSTLRLQYFQGAKFIKDYDPENSPYIAMLANTKCTTTNYGIELSIRALQITIESADVSWRPELTDFIENAAIGQKYSRTDVNLTPDDQAFIKNLLAPFDESGMFLSKITQNSILVIRYEPSNTSASNTTQ